MTNFEQHFAELPLVAILRGIAPDEIEAVAEVLIGAGFRLIEVPLNSPDPFNSIERLAKFARDGATVGAGTVLSVDGVEQVAAASGKLVVSPNFNPAVLARSVALGLIPMPGIRTATEAFAAVEAGAQILKFFPCTLATASEISALNSVLPKSVPILAVGGIHAGHVAQFRAAGAAGLGIGSSLYKPGKPLEQLRADAEALVAAWRAR